jgi:hypothetical protein
MHAITPVATATKTTDPQARALSSRLYEHEPQGKYLRNRFFRRAATCHGAWELAA